MTNDVKATVIIAGLVAIIGAIGSAAVMIIAELNKTQDAVSEVSTKSDVVAKVQDEKLDGIHVLVNSRYSTVLEELARVRVLLAEATGKTVDERKAEEAINAADDQADRVEESKGEDNGLRNNTP